MKALTLLTITALTSVVCASLAARAQDDAQPQDQQQTTTATATSGDGSSSVSVTNIEEKEKPEESHSFFTPAVGLASFNGQDHVAAGFLLDLNLATGGRITVGPVLGLMYSSISQNGTAQLEDNDFILQLPGQLKVTFSPGSIPKFRVGAHGGVNVVYTQRGGFGNAAQDKRWDTFASLGGDLGYRASRAIELSLRPDWTIMQDFDMFTMTLGVGVAI